MPSWLVKAMLSSLAELIVSAATATEHPTLLLITKNSLKQRPAVLNEAAEAPILGPPQKVCLIFISLWVRPQKMLLSRRAFQKRLKMNGGFVRKIGLNLPRVADSSNAKSLPTLCLMELLFPQMTVSALEQRTRRFLSFNQCSVKTEQ